MIRLFASLTLFAPWALAGLVVSANFDAREAAAQTRRGAAMPIITDRLEPSSARRNTPDAPLRNAVEDAWRPFDAWLGESPGVALWRQRLQTDEMARQLAAEKPDLATLASLRARIAAQTSLASHPTRQTLLAALDRWIAALEPSAADALAAARAAGASPPTAVLLSAARKQLAARWKISIGEFGPLEPAGANGGPFSRSTRLKSGAMRLSPTRPR